MTAFRLASSAAARIDDTYDYSVRTWGEDQANAYIHGLFEHFTRVAEKEIPWRIIPAEYGVTGYFTRFRQHYVFHKSFPDGSIGIAAVLHVRMDLAGRLSTEFDTGSA